MSSDDERAPWSAADSDPPEHRCGFELLPGDVDLEEEPDDLEEWRTVAQSASCSREVWEDGRCRWHADADPDVLRKAVEERNDRVQNLDGVVLRDVELDGGVSFAGCRLRGATFDTVTARVADFADCDLRFAEFPDADLTAAEFPDADLRGAEFPDADLTAAEFPRADLRGAEFPRADLRFAEFPDAFLRGAEFPDASLPSAEFPDASLEYAEFPDAFLRGAEFPDANLRDAGFPNALLQFAEFPDASLWNADLSDADLSGVNLSGADLRGVDMTGTTANQGTTVGRMCTELSSPEEYDQLAQAYHELKEALSEEGLSQRARQARALEQQARTAEAWERFKHQSSERVRRLPIPYKPRQWLWPPWPSPEIRTQFFTAVGGTLSRGLTGYGTRPLYVLVWTAVIVLVTTALFAFGPTPDGGWTGGPLYYSIVTFVTAPPHPPKQVGALTRAVVLLETYLGTALIVLLGYVLGTRERV
jgi:uncharacterized protein YjbI with pentapeptide repeats